MDRRTKWRIMEWFTGASAILGATGAIIGIVAPSQALFFASVPFAALAGPFGFFWGGAP